MNILHWPGLKVKGQALCGKIMEQGHALTLNEERVTCADCDNLLADKTTSSENTQPLNLNDELENAKSWAESAKQEVVNADDKVSRLTRLEYHLRNVAKCLEPGETYSLPDCDIHVTRM